MLGLELTRSEWAAVAAIAYLAVRVACGVGLVLWWYASDSLRQTALRVELTLVTGVAVATMCVALLSIGTGWPLRGFRILLYIGTAAVGFMLGIAFDMVVSIRLWRMSTWLMSLRVPRYRERLLHGDAEVRLSAAKRLAALAGYSRAARPELLAAIRGDDAADVRTQSALAILYSIPDPPDEDAELAKEFRPALADADPRVRTIAAAVQTTFHTTPAADLLPILCAGLTTRDEETAGIAAEALGRLGAEAASAIPDLQASAMDRERGNLIAPEALAKIGETAIPALLVILEGGPPNSRSGAAEALGGMGSPARVALPALRLASEDKDEIVAGAAKRAIRKLGGEIA
jgi:HEAT repeat protein